MTRRPSSGRAVRQLPSTDRAELAQAALSAYEATGSIRRVETKLLVSYGTARRLILEAGGTLNRPGRAPKAAAAPVGDER